MENDYPGNTLPQTVPNMIRASVQQYPETIAVGYKEHEGGNNVILRTIYQEPLQ